MRRTAVPSSSKPCPFFSGGPIRRSSSWRRTPTGPPCPVAATPRRSWLVIVVQGYCQVTVANRMASLGRARTARPAMRPVTGDRPPLRSRRTLNTLWSLQRSRSLPHGADGRGKRAKGESSTGTGTVEINR